MSKTKWPSQAAIRRVIKKVAANPQAYTSYELPREASEKDRIKFGLCGEFVKYMNRNGITQRELARRIGIDEALVSKIVRNRINAFSLDRLYDFLNILEPSLTLKVARKNAKAA